MTTLHQILSRILLSGVNKSEMKALPPMGMAGALWHILPGWKLGARQETNISHRYLR